MAHAIGQEHEQSRDDRDNYVTMLWSNIDGGENNRNMKKTNTYDNNPYDYESVLQYSLTVRLCVSFFLVYSDLSSLSDLTLSFKCFPFYIIIMVFRN